MKLPQGKIRFASVFLFLVLAVNFMAAQELKQHVDNPGQTAIKSPTATFRLPDKHGAGAPGSHWRDSRHRQWNQLSQRPGHERQSINAYIIWYGNWNGTGSNTAATGAPIEHFLSTIGGSASNWSTPPTATLRERERQRAFWRQHDCEQLNQSELTRACRPGHNALNSGSLPRDSNGVYFVLSSSNINETSGFCTQYCGWHTRATLGGVDIKYSFVGNVDRCPSGCEIQTTGPNSPATGVGGIDGMANVMSHELEEAISDPDLNAWFDTSGQENADKCNFNFGATSTCNANGLCSAAGTSASKYNQTFGSNDWMLQQNWRNSGGGALRAASVNNLFLGRLARWRPLFPF